MARQGVDATMLSRRTDGPERGVMGENRNANGPIRVLLADDHTMFREGLAGILASYAGMEVVAEVSNDGDRHHVREPQIPQGAHRGGGQRLHP